MDVMGQGLAFSDGHDGMIDVNECWFSYARENFVCAHDGFK